MESQAQQKAPGRPRNGCLYYGCILGLVLALMLVVGLLFGLRYAKKMVTDFTQTTPAALPVLPLTPAQVSEAARKVEAFRESLRAGKPTPPLELSADDLNALILTNADLQPLRGRIYVTLSGGQIRGQVSVPMEDLGVPIFKGRYLNGTGLFNLSFRTGSLRLSAESLEVKGKPVPEAYMERIRKNNLAGDFNRDPRVAATLESLESIQVKDGKLILAPRAAAP